MANAISRAVQSGYQKFSQASDQLNADKLANRLVELGYNSGLTRAGGVVAGGIGVAGAAGATALLWENMNPVDTLFKELPQHIAAQTGFAHQALEVLGSGLEAAAEMFILANTVNFGVQSVDATIDMLAQTKRRSLKLKDFPERPSRIKLDDTRRA